MKIIILTLFLFSCYNGVNTMLLEPNIEIKRDFFDNGSPRYQFTYKLGKLDGVSKTWDINGNLISIVNYKDGMLSGEWKTFYIGGQLKNSVIYLNGKKNGVELWYHPNGEKQSEVIYENNEIVSRMLRWDEQGRKINF